MKKYLFFLFSFITSLLVISCQDEDFGYTEEEIFRNAYERNFEAKYGKIDPEETWDFSTYGREHRNVSSTRSGSDDGCASPDGYYYVEPGTMNWIRQNLVDGNNNSSLGVSFGLLQGRTDFEIIPVYQHGDDDVEWTLHIVEVTSTGTTDYNNGAWNRSERIQIIGGTTDCNNPTCNNGMSSTEGDNRCVKCDGAGYIPGTGHDCPNPNCVDGKIPVECSNCSGYGFTSTCTTCHGAGYRFLFDIISFSPFIGWVGCADCGGNSKKEKGCGIGNYRNRDTVLKNNGALGTGVIDCKGVGGSDSNDKCDKGKVLTTCPTCVGAGTMDECDACGHDGKGTICATCNGSGKMANGEWHAIDGAEEKTNEATSIRSTPLSLHFSEGSFIYFYVEITKGKNGYATKGAKQSSLASKMIILNYDKIPDNIKSAHPDYEVNLVGCEESTSDNDFNDLVFLIVGHPRVPAIINATPGSSFNTIVQKRYMIEDFGSVSDWDFNDAVVDVTQTTKKTVQADRNGVVTKLASETPITSGILYWLCGTAPIQITVGTTQLANVTDPTNQEQTAKQLEKQRNTGSDSFSGKEQTGWSPGYAFSITGWTPQNNKISVKVKREKNGSDNTGIWSSTFPEPGETPYIIATDVNVNIQPEGKSIEKFGPDWWNGVDVDYSTN